ncbi:carotenoid biosynthesis protein [Aquimarina sp. MMG016]|uniref:carotenoid biosynthesis protein n=1 Tax=Aquimarina sp. MMG016 TaxID=2822690 RepID=UPI001B3A308B|nr:carotenoid biosynthesis protein [Aquimarina sp. MMG016]MBQ4819013.1 carotenoid biosynthesis protein [Aquimarina sp. MMG016]
MNWDKRLITSVIIIWLFNISGIIGVFLGYEDWFMSLTPLNLLIYITLIFWNNRLDKRLLTALTIPFFIGMITEALGVNYGLIFGNYEYGENLGWKIFGVPLIIGVNWAILVYCASVIAQKIYSNLFITSLIGAILMVSLDLIIEVSAPRFDFWEFDRGVVPLQNYIGWFCTAFVANVLFQKVIKTVHYGIAIHVFIVIFVFFTTFLFI